MTPAEQDRLKTLPIFSRSQDGGEDEDATYKVLLANNVDADRCTRLASGVPSYSTWQLIRNYVLSNEINDFLSEGQMGRLSIFTYDKDLKDITCIGHTSYKELGVW